MQPRSRDKCLLYKGHRCPWHCQAAGILSVVSVKAADCKLPMFCLRGHRARIGKRKRISDSRFFFCDRNRPGTAVLQKLPRFHCPDGEPSSLRRSSGSCPLPAASTKSAVTAPWISVSQTTREAFLVEQRIGRAGHDANLILQGVPALNRGGVAAVFHRQIFYSNLQRPRWSQVPLRPP